jgi:hypothetical protein
MSLLALLFSVMTVLRPAVNPANSSIQVDFLITLNGHQTRKMNKNFLWSIKISSVNVRPQNQSLVMTKTEKS